MDVSQFFTSFDLLSTGILETVKDDLVDPGSGNNVRAELYKLNIYSKHTSPKPYDESDQT